MKVDTELLKKQIKALLESNIDEDSKTGLHNLLGEILDSQEDGYFRIPSMSVHRNDLDENVKNTKKITDEQMEDVAEKLKNVIMQDWSLSINCVCDDVFKKDDLI